MDVAISRDKKWILSASKVKKTKWPGQKGHGLPEPGGSRSVVLGVKFPDRLTPVPTPGHLPPIHPHPATGSHLGLYKVSPLHL